MSSSTPCLLLTPTRLPVTHCAYILHSFGCQVSTFWNAQGLSSGPLLFPSSLDDLIQFHGFQYNLHPGNFHMHSSSFNFSPEIETQLPTHSSSIWHIIGTSYFTYQNRTLHSLLPYSLPLCLPCLLAKDTTLHLTA